jgi:hypothetical protein
MEKKETSQITTDKELSSVYSMFTNSGLVLDYETGGTLVDSDNDPLNFTVNDLIVKTDLTRFGVGLPQ